MAALLAALEHVLERGRLRRNVIVVGEADEEMAQRRRERRDRAPRRDAKVDWALATEPTRHAARRPATRAGWRCGSRPRPRLPQLQPGRRRERDRAGSRAPRSRSTAAARRARVAARHPRLGSGTLGVTLIGGGHAPNIVPDHAFLIADRRTTRYSLLRRRAPRTARRRHRARHDAAEDHKRHAPGRIRRRDAAARRSELRSGFGLG